MEDDDYIEDQVAVSKAVGERTAYLFSLEDERLGVDLFVGEEIVFNGVFNVDESHEIIKLADDFLYCRNEWRLH